MLFAPWRVCRRYEYEAVITERNLVAAEAQVQVPAGRRFHAGNEYMARLGQEREEYDDWEVRLRTRAAAGMLWTVWRGTRGHIVLACLFAAPPRPRSARTSRRSARR